MSRRLRLGFAVIAVLVIGLVATAAVFVYTADYNRYKGLIEKAVLDATGRQLAIKGDLTIAMSLPPELAVTDATLANAPWGSQPQMAHVGQLRVRLKILPLLKRDVDITRIRLIDTDLLLETDASGQANWQFSHKAGSRTSVGIRGVAVEHLEIEQLAVTLRNGETGSPAARYQLDSLKLTRSPAADSLAVELKGSLNEQPVALSGQTGPLRDLFAGVRFPLTLSGDVAGATVKLRGELGNALTLEGLDLTVQASGTDLAELSSIVGKTLPETGPFEISGKLAGTAKALALSEAQGTIGQHSVKVSLAGRIDDLMALKGISLNLKGSGKNLGELRSLLGEKLPDTGPFSATAHLTGSAQALAVGNLRATVSQGNSQLAVSGKVGDLLQVTGIDLSLEGSGKNLGELGPPFDTQLPDLGPFRINGQLSGSDQLLELKNFSATVDQSDFAGWAKAEFGKRPKVTVRSESGLIDFTRIMEQTRGEKKPEKGKAGGSRQTVFSDEPLPFDVLDAVDADIAFSARNIKAHDAALEFGELALRLDAGELRIEKLEATYRGTKVSANLNLTAGTPSNVAMRFLVQGFDLGRFLKETRTSQDVEGQVDLAAHLKSQGNSPHRLMANLDGIVGAVIGKGYVPRYLDFLASDLSRRVIPIWGRHEQSGQLNCGVIQFTNKAGIATSDAFLFDTQLGILKGDGEINLATEQLDFILSPKPKDPSLFSLATKLRVTGNIQNPRVRPDARSLATKGVKALGSLAVGPAGLLVPFMKAGARHPHVCDIQELKSRVQSIYE